VSAPDLASDLLLTERATTRALMRSQSLSLGLRAPTYPLLQQPEPSPLHSQILLPARPCQNPRLHPQFRSKAGGVVRRTSGRSQGSTLQNGNVQSSHVFLICLRLERGCNCSQQEAHSHKWHCRLHQSTSSEAKGASSQRRQKEWWNGVKGC
jgi:hypothetical protein